MEVFNISHNKWTVGHRPRPQVNQETAAGKAVRRKVMKVLSNFFLSSRLSGNKYILHYSRANRKLF